MCTGGWTLRQGLHVKMSFELNPEWMIGWRSQAQIWGKSITGRWTRTSQVPEVKAASVWWPVAYDDSGASFNWLFLVFISSDSPLPICVGNICDVLLTNKMMSYHFHDYFMWYRTLSCYQTHPRLFLLLALGKPQPQGSEHWQKPHQLGKLMLP